MIADIDAAFTLTRSPCRKPDEVSPRRMKVKMRARGYSSPPDFDIARTGYIDARPNRVKGGQDEPVYIESVPAINDPADEICPSVPPHLEKSLVVMPGTLAAGN
ncbi:hypothetical protein [Parvibaculum sp.]|uniref:hypothetical protein n=1 Tax=Parvibaculum sp. TaxID=2024848 RepID=UPI0025F25AEC|nr:hypothetical protein [Parvibaculum sp.]